MLGRSVSQSLCFVHIALYAFTNKDKRVIHKLLNKQIAARAKGVWLQFFTPVFRRSQIICPNPKSTTLFQFQTETDILQEWYNSRAINQLVGFENDHKDGTGNLFNFILSNGTRSTQRDKNHPTKYTHMIPAETLHKIRSVTIHYYINECIGGFSFFDKDGTLLWKIGWTWPSLNLETVLLDENEMIIGVQAKLYNGYQSDYTEL